MRMSILGDYKPVFSASYSVPERKSNGKIKKTKLTLTYRVEIYRLMGLAICFKLN